MRWLRYALLIVGLVALGACAIDRPTSRDMAPGVEAGGSLSPALPDGWRWESYRGVEVGVPPDWGWGSGDQRLGQWCINPTRPKPIVGRPGTSTAVACVRGKEGKPAPETLIKNTGWIVAFEDAALPDGSVNRIVEGGDRQVVTYGKVSVVVQVPASLRTRIIATIHLVKVDHQGCPASDPVSLQPARHPVPATDVALLRGVTSISVCKYAIPATHDSLAKTGLLSSLRYDGKLAARVVRQIVAAPTGGGPDTPKACTERLGSEIMVLRVSSSTGGSQIRVRYSACDHHGFDDGVNVRALTRDPMQALINGPNALWSWDRVLDPILRRDG